VDSSSVEPLLLQVKEVIDHLIRVEQGGMSIDVYDCIYVFVYMYMHVYICVDIYVYIYLYMYV